MTELRKGKHKKIYLSQFFLVFILQRLENLIEMTVSTALGNKQDTTCIHDKWTNNLKFQTKKTKS